MNGGPNTRSVAVVGCGLIGESWAALFLFHGYDVHAWDPSEQVRQGFAGRVGRILDQLADMAGEQAGTRGTLSVEPTLPAAVRDCFLVQENAPESVPVKQALYAEIEAAARDEAIISSSTSSLTWSDLSPRMRLPNRLVTAHPFNPPHLMPLVELYGRTAAVADRAEAFYRSVGRAVVRLKKDAVGHIANRLASALWREAVHIVAEGIADVADIDAAMVNGPGLRWAVMGPHMSYHLGGGRGGMEHYLKTLGPSQERRWEALGQPSLTPDVCAALVDGVNREAAGRSIEELEKERDAGLRRMLAARRGERQ